MSSGHSNTSSNNHAGKMFTFLRVLFFVFPIITSISTDGQYPSFVQQPQDWIVDIAFNAVNYSTTASTERGALFECKGEGNPKPSIEWFVFAKRLNQTFGPITATSPNFTIFDNISAIRVEDAKYLLPVVYCEAFNSFGRIKSRRAKYIRRGRYNDNSLTYVKPSWITLSHALIICPRKEGFLTEEPLPDGGTIHSQHSWGDSYRHEAYYDNHTGTDGKKSLFPMTDRSDVYWNGPFFVISNQTLQLSGLFFCIQIWRPRFITGTRQKPTDYLHESPYPKTNGTYVDYPYLVKTMALARYLTKMTTTDKLSVRIFNVNPNGFVIGSPITLDCLTFSSETGLTLDWLINDQKVDNTSSRIHLQPILGFGMRLIINTLQSNDTGNFTCIVNNGPVSHKATIPVQPQSPLQFLDNSGEPISPLATADSLAVQEGSEVTLECRFLTQAWEYRQVKWLHNARPVPVERAIQSFESGRSTLRLRHMDAELDTGVYQCVLSDDSGAEIVRNVAIVRLGFSGDFNHNPPTILPISANFLSPILVARPNGSLAGLGVYLLVADGDVGRCGRVSQCLVRCGREEVSSDCPLYLKAYGKTPRGDLQLFQIAGRVPNGLQYVRIDCEDADSMPRRSSVTVVVQRCRGNVGNCDVNLQPTDDLVNALLWLLRTGLSPVTAKKWTAAVQKAVVTAERRGIGEGEVQLFLAVLESGASSSVASDHLPLLVESTGRVLKAPKSSKLTTEVAERALRLLGTLSSSFTVAPGETKSLNGPEIAVGVVRLPKGPTEGNSVAQFAISRPGANKQAVKASIGSLGLNSSGISVALTAVVGGLVEFGFTNDTDLFAILSGTDEKASRLISPIFAAKTALKRSSDQPVTIAFNGASSLEGRLRCAFWNFTTRRWAYDGCRTELSSSNGLVICRCQHLTNFALLLDPNRSDALPAAHQTVLTFLSYLLLTISAIFLVITIIVYSAFLHREIRRQGGGQNGAGSAREARITASKVLISLCSALLAGTFVFLISGYYNRPGAVCIMVGVLLHFLFLAVFCWAVVEATHIFATVVYVSLRSSQISVHISHFFLKASLFAWGVPFVIVTITLGVNFTKNYGADRICFLKEIPFYASFLTPMLLCLAVNIGVLVLLAIVLRRFSYASVGRSPVEKRSYWRQHVIGFVGICFILNVSWLIGIVQVKGGKIVVHYLHVLINGLQGLFIFLFYCVFRNDLRKFMRKRLRRVFAGIDSGTGKTVSTEVASGSTSTAKANAGDGYSSGSAGLQTRTEMLSGSGNNLEPTGKPNSNGTEKNMTRPNTEGTEAQDRLITKNESEKV